MKKLLFLTRVVLVSAALALAASCTKTIQQDSFAQDKVLGEKQALEEFAVILSDAVADNEEMREFIKEEALKQFDKDYDVFYPYVKDHVFSSGESFREILSAREKYEGQLESIERSVPKLTILVPNFSWLDKEFFRAEKWDTSIDRLCVGYDDDDDADAHRLYFDGEYQGALPASVIPAFPVLIVKSNERMSVSGATKNGENVYAFADPVFDGSVSTKGNYWLWGKEEEYWENPNPGWDLYSEVGDDVSKTALNKICPEAIKAYEEFRVGSTAGVQRDYVYYGMSKTNTNNGKLNPFMRDILYRIRFTPHAISAMSDDPSDPNDVTKDTFWTGKNDRPDFPRVLPRMWGNGNYEIKLQYYQNYPGTGASQIGSSVLAFGPEEIMYAKRLYHTFQWNLGDNWSGYKITKADLEPRWYYPTAGSNVIYWVNTTWNLSTMSDNIWVKVLEYDPTGTETYSDTKTFKRSWSVSPSVTGEVPVGKKEGTKIGFGVSGEYGQETSESVEFKWTRNTGSDELGEFELRYMDNYIIGPSSRGVGFKVNSWGNGYFAVCFLPIDSRNASQISGEIRSGDYNPVRVK